jgi:hypothetical protein
VRVHTGRTVVTDGFAAAAWDRVGDPGGWRGRRWLTAMASRVPGRLHTAVHGDRAAALLAVVDDPGAYESYNPYALLFADPPVFQTGDPDGRRRGLAALAVPPERVLPAAVVVHPGYAGDPVGAAAAVPPLLTDLRDWAANRGLRGLYVLYTERLTRPVAAAADRLGGASFPLATRWRLPVWWKDWDGYLAGLPSRRRVELARQRRRAAELGVRPAVVDPQRYLDPIVAGRCALLRRYGHAADPVAERARLAALVQAYGLDLRVYAALRDEELLAATVAVRDRGSVLTVHAGAVEATDPVPFAHFVANYYAVVDDVTVADTTDVDYGLGQDQAKRLRGCHGSPLTGHVVPVEAAAAEPLVRAAGLLAGRPPCRGP